MHETALLLARLQFAFTVSFHFLFPPFTIGLAAYLAVLEGLWLKTGKPLYLDLFRYWLKIFAINFAMGVVSGIVLSYEFGTNWAVFSDKAGPVIGPLMAYEVLTAFFLEAGFLGVMLFGMEKVGRGLHFAATVCVALGTLLSSFWILAANSWMHTPAGFVIDHRIVGQRARHRGHRKTRQVGDRPERRLAGLAAAFFGWRRHFDTGHATGLPESIRYRRLAPAGTRRNGNMETF